MTIKRTKAGHPATRAKRRLRPATARVARARSSDAGDITSKPVLIGYARVSTVDQNLALQRDALTAAGCERVFTDEGVSGSVTARRGLDGAFAALGPGDTLVGWKLDRLGPSLSPLFTPTAETVA